MKKRIIVSLLMIFWWIFSGSVAWAIDTGWMQKGVRVWYFGSAGSGMSSNAVESYLFGPINGNNVPVTHHSALTHWTLPNPVDTTTYSIIDQGPCWIHPTVLQNIKVGDTWLGIEIKSMYRVTYNSYNDFKNNNDEFDSLPYLLLPIKALFDLQPQREVVKLVYGNPLSPDFDEVWGTAFFDTETGLCLFNLRLTISNTVWFILSEINYDFATHTAYAEDNGPHTGFLASVIKSSTPSNLIDIDASVETRYGEATQMFTSTQAGGSITSFLPVYENYCFFGNVPVVKRSTQSIPPVANYPPENWNEFGEYLWWWLPQEALQSSAINIYGAQMTRTSTSPYTFEGTGGTGLYFSKIIFSNDGYITDICAKDTALGLDLCAGSTIYNTINVDGLDYYTDNMGAAEPEPGSSPAVATNAANGISTTSATLNGTVNPNGNATTAHFEYGLTTSYGTSANVTLASSDGTSVQNVSASISNLQTGTTYHFRLVATNGHGTVNSNDATFNTTASNNNGGTSDNDGGGGGGGGGGIFGAISVSDVIGYHLDGVMRNGINVYMPVTKGYQALKGAQTHVEKFAPVLAKLIRGGFESLERAAEGHKDGILYRVGTYSFPVLGKIAELYLGVVGSRELMVNAYSGTMISVAEFNKLHQKGVAVSPHIVKWNR